MATGHTKPSLSCRRKPIGANLGVSSPAATTSRLSPRRKPGPINADVECPMLAARQYADENCLSSSVRPISLSVYPSDCSNRVSSLQVLCLWAPAFAGVTTSRWRAAEDLGPKLAPMGFRRHDNEGVVV